MPRRIASLLLLAGLTFGFNGAMAQTGPSPTEPAAERPVTKPRIETQPAAAPVMADSAPDTPDPDQIIAPASDFDHSACLLTLFLLGTDYDEPPAIVEPDHPECGIPRPVRVNAILPGLVLDGAPVMRCELARELAFWLRDTVRPAATFLPGSPRILRVEPGSTYQCRNRVGSEGDKVSEHAQGNAFDIMAFGLSDGSRLVIEPRQDTGNLAESFQQAIRGSACLYFTTVLGPGADSSHDDHLHLDLKARKGGWRLCQ